MHNCPGVSLCPFFKCITLQSHTECVGRLRNKRSLLCNYSYSLPLCVARRARARVLFELILMRGTLLFHLCDWVRVLFYFFLNKEGHCAIQFDRRPDRRPGKRRRKKKKVESYQGELRRRVFCCYTIPRPDRVPPPPPPPRQAEGRRGMGGWRAEPRTLYALATASTRGQSSTNRHRRSQANENNPTRRTQSTSSILHLKVKVIK